MHLDNRKAKEIVFYSDFSLLLTGFPPNTMGRKYNHHSEVLDEAFFYHYCCEAAAAQQLCLSAGGALLVRIAPSANMRRNLKFVHSLRGNVHPHLLVETSGRTSYGGQCCAKLQPRF